jgi:site-specific DNA recombinase
MQNRNNPVVNPKVRVIPVVTNHAEYGEEENRPKKKVAAYARLSTLEEEQQSRYNLQVSYFKEYIDKNPDWEFYKVYSDEGVTGTNTKYRTGFNEMIEDAKAGKFDYIITKSISRFARNTLDCLTYVRMLKNLEKPIGVYFDRENLDSLDSRSDLLLAIIASISEEESKTISANVSWGVTKRFSQGIPHIPTTYFLGYDEDEEGNLIINEEEAKIVRRIYRELLDGKGTGLIAKGLTRDKVKTARGNIKWTSDSVLKILRNEKFAGHALCQKTVTLDPLTHKRVRNKNHKPQYFIRNHHPPIIPEDEWNEVQMELDRRNKMHHDPDGKYRSAYSGKAPFSNILFCGLCGRPMIRRRMTSQKNGEKYLFTTWHCRVASHKLKEDFKCNAKYIWEDVLEEAFLEMLNEMKKEKEQIRIEGEQAVKEVSLTEEEKRRLQELEGIIDRISGQINDMSLRGNATNDPIYDATIKNLIYEAQIYQEEYEKLLGEQEENAYLKKQLDKLLEYLDGPVSVSIFRDIVAQGILHENYEIEFTFKCGVVRTAYGRRRGRRPATTELTVE